MSDHDSLPSEHTGDEKKVVSDDQPLVSVVVCVYNRPLEAIACIDTLAAQSYSRFEILVIDDCSPDPEMHRLHEHVRSCPRASLRINPVNRGLSCSRNEGLRYAEGEIVVFIGPDCLAPANYLERIVSALQASDAIAVSGRVIDSIPKNWAGWAVYGNTYIARAKTFNRHLIGNNMGFVRSALEQFYFDEKLRLYADEDDLARRLIAAGHKIAFAPDAIVYHHHPMTLRSYLRQAWLQGQGSAYFWWKRRIFIGRDILFLVLAIVTLPLIVMDWRLGFVPLVFFGLHLAAHIFNERFLKGKSWLVTFYVLPLVMLYTIIKTTSVAWWWVMNCGSLGSITSHAHRH